VRKERKEILVETSFKFKKKSNVKLVEKDEGQGAISRPSRKKKASRSREEKVLAGMPITAFKKREVSVGGKQRAKNPCPGTRVSCFAQGGKRRGGSSLGPRKRRGRKAGFRREPSDALCFYPLGLMQREEGKGGHL